MAERRTGRRRLAAFVGLLSLLAPVLATSASYSAPGLRASVTAGRDTAGAATRLTVDVDLPARLRHGAVRIALPDGWPSPVRGSVGLDAGACAAGPARLSADGLAVARLRCPAGAAISLSVSGRLPTRVARYVFTTTVTERAGRHDDRTSRSVTSPFTVVPAEADHLVLSPAGTTITLGESRSFRAYETDAFGNRRGEVTDRASFTMTPDGGCAGAVCGEGAHAGDHVVTGSLGDLDGRADLSVEPRHVTVSARPATKVYGAADPAFGYTVDGLPGGATTLPGVTCGVAEAHVGVGTYPVSCRGADDGDYVVDRYRPSTLTVTPARLVVPVTGTQTYGGTPAYLPDLASAGLVNGDVPAVVGGALSCDTTATASSGVGSYPISGCRGLSAANYTIGYAYGSLQVTPRPVTVVADDQTMTAGDADPVFTYRTVPAGLTLAGVTCDAPGDHSAPGTDAITCSTTTDPNHSQVSVPGTLTIGAAAAVCGDSTVQAGEACDDGNAVTETSCPYGDATCYACNSTCSAALNLTGPYCGDSVKQADEVCDDGNAIDESSCPYGSASCLTCSSSCSAVLTLTGNVCGDAKVTDAEVCDDGNTTDETSCPYGQATCNTCSSTCSAVLNLTGGYCGDGVKQAEETCDDGNTTDETSCPYGTATCTSCAASCGSVLSLTGGYCGDGTVTDGEACDDGDLAGGPCNNTCSAPA